MYGSATTPIKLFWPTRNQWGREDFKGTFNEKYMYLFIKGLMSQVSRRYTLQKPPKRLGKFFETHIRELKKQWVCLPVLQGKFKKVTSSTKCSLTYIFGTSKSVSFKSCHEWRRINFLSNIGHTKKSLTTFQCSRRLCDLTPQNKSHGGLEKIVRSHPTILITRWSKDLYCSGAYQGCIARGIDV